MTYNGYVLEQASVSGVLTKTLGRRRVPRRSITAWGGAILLFGAIASSAFAQFKDDRFETVQVVQAADVLPAYLYRSAHYRVLDDVRVRENTFIFQVEGGESSFTVASTPLLRTRLKELTVLAQAVAQFNVRNEALGAQLRGTLNVRGRSFGAIIASPLSTAANLAGQLSRNVQETLGAEVEREQVSRPPPGIDKSDPVAAAHRRNIASQLSLDVYSTNPQVQRFLNAVVRAREAGDVGAGISLLTTPFPAGMQVAGGAMASNVDALVRQLSAAEVNSAVTEELMRMGIGEPAVRRFVSNSAMSPRHRLTIAAHLDFLGPLEGRQVLIDAANGARTETEALAYQEMVRMFAHYHESHPIRGFVVSAGLPGALDGRGNLVLALPVDLVIWDEAMKVAAGRLSALKARRKLRNIMLLTIGQATALTRRALGQQGIELAERYMENK
ncbi:MAG: hypothetical protein GKR94_08890 [Gammaproteobacteria bacterium]|nr:hypothetical protein [Gammaproteobacteria bacterium]